MRPLRDSVRVAVFLLCSASFASASTVEWKCGGRSMSGYGTGEVVFILDGVVGKMKMEKMSEIEAEAIDRIEVTCWNPHNGKFRIAPGVPVVLAWTKEFVAAASERLEDALREHETQAAADLRLLYEAGRF